MGTGRVFAVLLLAAGAICAQKSEGPQPPVVDPGGTDKAPSDAVVLFNGRDNAGWTTMEGAPSKCTVAGGVMICRTGAGETSLGSRPASPPGEAGRNLFSTAEVYIFQSITSVIPPLIRRVSPPGPPWHTGCSLPEQKRTLKCPARAAARAIEVVCITSPPAAPACLCSPGQMRGTGAARISRIGTLA